VAAAERAAKEAERAAAIKAKAEKAAAAQDRKRAADEGDSPAPDKARLKKFKHVDDADKGKPAEQPKPEAVAPSEEADPALVAKAQECIEQLASEAADVAAAALAELEAMPMTLAILAASGVGKPVNKLKKGDTPLAPRAKRLVERWKTLTA